MEENKYLYEIKPERVKAVKWDGENGMEVNKFASGYGKHDIGWGDGELWLNFNCYDRYRMKKGEYLVDHGGKLKVERGGYFESRYRKVGESNRVGSMHYVNPEYD